MKEQMTARARWCLVVAFAVAMAWMEAATVFYIRSLVGRIEPYQPEPLPIHGALGNVELVREAATLVMLVAPPTTMTRSACCAMSTAAVCRSFVGLQTVSKNRTSDAGNRRRMSATMRRTFSIDCVV